MFGGDYNAGASQFAGGFMPSPKDQAGSASAQKKSQGYNDHSVRRVTIKQIADSFGKGSPDSIMVDGKELVNVCIDHCCDCPLYNIPDQS